MALPPPNPPAWRFGRFELARAGSELLEDGNPVHMPQQSLQVLHRLVAHAGEVVTRQQLQQMLWPGNVELGRDDALNSIIRRLRRALRDDMAEPRYLATVPGRGYRFIGLEPAPTGVAMPAAVPVPPRRYPYWVAAGLVAVLGGAWAGLRPLPPPRVSSASKT